MGDNTFKKSSYKHSEGTSIFKKSVKNEKRALHFEEKIVWQISQFPLMGHSKNEGKIP